MATASSKPYEIKLINDYTFDEVASALQKCIRRNLEYEACYWASYNSRKRLSQIRMETGANNRK